MHPSIPASFAVMAVAAVALTLPSFVVTAAPVPVTAPVIREPQERPAPPPPKPLGDAARVAAQTQALRQVGAPPTITLPPRLEMRLTPMAPRLENGTRIVIAEDIAFVGASSEQPDGLYWLLGDDAGYRPHIKMRVHTDKDSLYVADCRMTEIDQWGHPVSNKITVDAPGIQAQQYTGSDGHVLFAFRGEASGSTVELTYYDPSGDRYRAMLFYGCDFGKAG